MMYQLPKPVRQLLAVALLLLLVGGCGILVAGPIWSHIVDLQDRIDQARMMVGRLSELANDDSARRALEEQTKAALSSGIFIEGESEAIRLATLQSNLSALAAAQGVKFRSARNLPTRERNDLRLIGVQVQLVVPIDRLQKLMLEIEQSRPMLIVEQIQITPLTLSRLPDDPQVGLLDARIDILAIETKHKDKT